MYYLIYKITNMINDKIYIGKHKTEDKDDNYMGSGNVIKRAINKYGINNFKKDILFSLSNAEEMNIRESEIVNDEFIRLNSNYNLMPGGQGGNSIKSYSPEKLKRSNIKKSEAVSKIWSELTEEEKYKRNKKGQDKTNQTEKGKKISSWRKNFFSSETYEEKMYRIEKAKIGAKKVKKSSCDYCKKNISPGNFKKHVMSCKLNPDSKNYGKFVIKKTFVVMSPDGEILELSGNFRKMCDELNISSHILQKNIGNTVTELSPRSSNITNKSLNTIGWRLISIKEIKY